MLPKLWKIMIYLQTKDKSDITLCFYGSTLDKKSKMFDAAGYSV